MEKLVIYIHGKGGDISEAEFYKDVFRDADVIGFDYRSQTPWEAKDEFVRYFDGIKNGYDHISIVANSIGAYFSIVSLGDKEIDRAYFISPIVDMERLICDMLRWSGNTEKELTEKGEIKTDLGETLSVRYLDYARSTPVSWRIPTEILYGEGDRLQSYETVKKFACTAGAKLTVMPDGEHWFHTDRQMRFLENWLRKNK